MKRLVVALVLLASVSSLAMAWVPDPEHCTITPLFGPDAAHQGCLIAPANLSGNILTITVLNAYDVPYNGTCVNVVFPSDPGAEIGVCTYASLTAYTNSSGVCQVTLLGGGCRSDLADACVITANGVPIRTLRFVKSPDNASHAGSLPDGQVDTVDLTFFSAEFKGHVQPGCHDYTNDGLCDTVDLTYFADAFRTTLHCELVP